MAYIVSTINFCKKNYFEIIIVKILYYIIFNFISKFEMYMEVKLNWTYIIEKKYFEILLKITKNIFFLNYNILYRQNNFVVKLLYEKLLEIHKVG